MGSIPHYKPITERRSTSLQFEEDPPSFWDYFWTVFSVLAFAGVVVGLVALAVKGLSSSVY